MTETLLVWCAFIVTAAGIIGCGWVFCGYADRLAEKFNLSKSLVGVFMVSLVTTLPEGAVTISSVMKVGSPDLALGNAYGSIIFNLTIIAICDLMLRGKCLFAEARREASLSAACAAILITLSMLSINFSLPVSLGGLTTVSLGSIGVLLCYVVVFVVINRHEADIEPVAAHAAPHTEPELAQVVEMSALRIVAGFVFAGLGVVFCGYWLAIVGGKLAELLGLSASVVGVVLMATATSLPELVVGISAVRLGAYDMMLGNVLGANMLNVVVIATADLAYRPAALSVPHNLGREQVFTAMMAVIGTGVVVIGLFRSHRHTSHRIADPVAFVLLGLYVASILTLFFGRDFLAGV